MGLFTSRAKRMEINQRRINEAVNENMIRRLGRDEARRQIDEMIAGMLSQVVKEMELAGPPMRAGDKVILNKYNLRKNAEYRHVTDRWDGGATAILEMLGKRAEHRVLHAVIERAYASTEYSDIMKQEFINSLDTYEMLECIRHDAATVFATFQKWVYDRTGIEEWVGQYWCVDYKIPELEFESKSSANYMSFLPARSEEGIETNRVWKMKIKRDRMKMECEAFADELYKAQHDIYATFPHLKK